MSTEGEKNRRPTRWLWPIGIIVMGLLGSFVLIKTKPKAKRRHINTKAVSLVEVVELESARYGPRIQASGTVQASRSVSLNPRVSGQVIRVNENFVPGAFFKAGQHLLSIDPEDYRLTLEQKTYEVARTLRDLRVERGRRSVALKEFEFIEESISVADRDLVLRKPQLHAAEAAVKSAQAAENRARLDVARTRIKVPFNSVVVSKNVEVGSMVSAGGNLGTLVGTDQCWIQVMVPVDQLKWIVVPESPEQKGSMVRIYHRTAWDSGMHRKGRVVRLNPDLAPNGRMASLLVEVDDPYGLLSPQPSLLMGMFVTVEIEGREVDGAIKILRSALRDGNKLWMLTAENKLRIIEPEVLWLGRDSLLVKNGFEQNQRLIVSDLSYAVEGMELTTASSRLKAGH
jgi:RND family efflux transporter MFP subunit